MKKKIMVFVRTTNDVPARQKFPLYEHVEFDPDYPIIKFWEKIPMPTDLPDFVLHIHQFHSYERVKDNGRDSEANS